mmetsp:Transcript_60003/g.105036  ORF Transcript_60003/g.105036 Transcript_60003/m.105036 type:complete len:120 (+) Transcript_60003:92-451(+)
MIAPAIRQARLSLQKEARMFAATKKMSQQGQPWWASVGQDEKVGMPASAIDTVVEEVMRKNFMAAMQPAQQPPRRSEVFARASAVWPGMRDPSRHSSWRPVSAVARALTSGTATLECAK